MLKDAQIYLLDAAYIPKDNIKHADIRLGILAVSVLLKNQQFSELDIVFQKIIENFSPVSGQFVLEMLRTSRAMRANLPNWEVLVAISFETGKLSKEQLKGMIPK